MITVGEFLRTYRQEKNLTLLQVSQATKVRLEFLRAIEEGEGYLLPSQVQAKGFLRLYADFLGLPASPLIDGWVKGEFSPDWLEPKVEEPEEPESIVEPEPIEPEVPPIEQEELPAIPTFSELYPDEPLKESQKIFNDIGRDFRSRREALSLTPQDIEKFTRLKSHYIEAIEAGRMELLPSLVQGRGMLSNYATFVDLDAEQILDRFAEALQARRVELNAPVDDKTIPDPARNRVKPLPFWRKYLTLDIVLGTFTFLAILTVIFWGTRQLNLNRGNDQVPAIQSVSEILLQTQTPTVAFAPTATVDLYLPTMLTQAPVVIDMTETPLIDGTTTPELTPDTNGGTLTLNLVAVERSWVRILVDGTQAFSGRVTPGNVYSYAGKTSIELLTGNGAGIKATFNGVDLGILGSTGQVVSLTFNQGGVIRPSPTPSPTPDATMLTQTAAQSITPTVTVTPTPGQ